MTVLYKRGCTTTELAAELVQRYTTVLPRSLRLQSYRHPEVAWVVEPQCDPTFAALIKATWKRLDLADRTQWSEDEARLLRAHRFYGCHALFKRGLSLHERFMTAEVADIQFTAFLAALSDLLGEQMLRLLGPAEVARWLPYHNFLITPDPSGHNWRMLCQSLLTATNAQGHTRYFSAQPPRLTLHGKTHVVAFAAHVLQRVGQRLTLGGTSYADLGSMFAFVDELTEVTVVRLASRQPALLLYEVCEPGFMSDLYPDQILAQRVPGVRYQYRLGY